MRTVDLTYSPEEATFDFPTLVSLAHQLGVVELVVWHQDVLKLDEAWIPRSRIGLGTGARLRWRAWIIR